MRISDWSSDVCASDLVARSFRERIGRERMGIMNFKRIGIGIGGVAGAALAVVGGALLYDVAARKAARGREIGRASCRERVWQNVYVSVGGVHLTKKKTNQNTPHKQCI